MKIVDAELTNDEIVRRIVKASSEKRLMWTYLGGDNYNFAFKCKHGEYEIVLRHEDFPSGSPLVGPTRQWVLTVSLQKAMFEPRQGVEPLLITRPQRELTKLGKELEKTMGPKTQVLKVTDGSFLP